jgi:lambda family phage portal protein
MGLFAKIKQEATNYALFRRGIMPPSSRFGPAFASEIDGIMKRYFPAAEVGDRRADWNPSTLIDQNVFRLEYKRICARAKRAYDTDPYARSAVRVLQSQVIGRGISPKARPVDLSGNALTELGKTIDAGFERFADECFRPNNDSFYDVQSRYIANCSYSGGVFLNTVPAPKSNLLPFAFQLVDQACIDFSRDTFVLPNNTDTVFNGVKLNLFGEPKEYYFENLVTYAPFKLAANNVIHCYEKTHINQWIGIPWLAAVLTTLWDLAQLQEDKLIASRIQTAIALWVSETGNKFPNAALKNANGNISWAPGSIMKSAIEPKIIQASDSIRETFGALIELYLRQIASGMGVSYQEMTCDLAGANFSSARTVVMDRRRYYRKKQQSIERIFCQPVYNRFLGWLFLTGKIPGKSIVDFNENKWGLCRAKWTPDKWTWVDPLKDIEALRAEQEAGWLSDEDYCEQVGKSRDDLYAVLMEEKALRKEMGIEIVPRQLPNKGFANQEENTSADQKQTD